MLEPFSNQKMLVRHCASYQVTTAFLWVGMGSGVNFHYNLSYTVYNISNLAPDFDSDVTEPHFSVFSTFLPGSRLVLALI